MHLVQNQKLSNFHKNQGEGFQAVNANHKKNKEQISTRPISEIYRTKLKISVKLNVWMLIFTFRSLWYTPLLWQWDTASISCWKYFLDSFSRSLPWWTYKSKQVLRVSVSSELAINDGPKSLFQAAKKKPYNFVKQFSSGYKLKNYIYLCPASQNLVFEKRKESFQL